MRNEKAEAISPAADAEWRTVPDPEYSVIWRCKNLVLQFRFQVGSFWYCRQASGSATTIDYWAPTRERKAVWRDLFIRPAADAP